MADAAARAAMLAEVRRQFGRLHVLVNNAGVAPKVRADLLEATEESFERVMRTNLQGPYFLTQAAARWMIEQKQADAGLPGLHHQRLLGLRHGRLDQAAASTASPRPASAMATQLWAARLGEFGIPVYEVRPGIIKHRHDRRRAGEIRQADRRGLARATRWGLPDDVGKACAMLVRGELTLFHRPGAHGRRRHEHRAAVASHELPTAEDAEDAEEERQNEKCEVEAGWFSFRLPPSALIPYRFASSASSAVNPTPARRGSLRGRRPACSRAR